MSGLPRVGIYTPSSVCFSVDPHRVLTTPEVWLDALPKAIVLDPALAQLTPEWLFLSTGRESRVSPKHLRDGGGRDALLHVTRR